MSAVSNKLFSKKHNILFLIILTLVVGISYGIGIHQLSFYGDDWIYIYNYHIAGPQSFALFTQWDRPHSAWIYVITSALFGESALAYHLCVLVLRWLSAFLFWLILKEAFNSHKSVSIAALLFATYPGFRQQPIAVEFVMHFTSMVLVLFSLRLMQKAYFLPGKRMILPFLLSLASGLLAIFTCEYFIGLELSRPILLYFTIRNKKIDKEPVRLSKRFALFLSPYLLAVIFFFIWRIFIFSFTTYGPKLITALQENFFNGIRLLVGKVLQDLSTVLVSAYRQVFSRPADIPMLSAILITALITAAVFLMLHQSKTNNDRAETNTDGGLLFYGICLLLLSGIPFWGTFLDVSTEFPWDRSTLSFSPGAAIIIAALLGMAFKPVFCCAAAALITALSALSQVQNTQVYISESQKMNDYFWQLAWRAPGLEKGTILASENIPLDRTSDNDLSPVVNWQYAPENRGLHYDYKYFDMHLREGIYYSDPLHEVPVEHTYRTHSFNSSTGSTLDIFYRKNGCLQIIDSSNILYPELPDSLIRTAPISNIDLIQTAPEKDAQPPKAIGSEPEHGYCYYFQKTALMQQKGDWDQAYGYAMEALRADLHPLYAPDLAPVILAFLNRGDFDSAEKMAVGNTIGSGDREYLCTYWQNGYSGESDNPELENFYKRHGCL